jgi:hypothetical protein
VNPLSSVSLSSAQHPYTCHRRTVHSPTMPNCHVQDWLQEREIMVTLRLHDDFCLIALHAFALSTRFAQHLHTSTAVDATHYQCPFHYSTIGAQVMVICREYDSFASIATHRMHRPIYVDTGSFRIQTVTKDPFLVIICFLPYW